MDRIKPRERLTEQQRREVLAALALAGHDQKTFAAEKGLSYSRMNRVIARREDCSPKYARAFEKLRQEHLRHCTKATAA